MLNLRTGKAFTRRDSIKGLAAILAAGCAPSIAKAAARGAGGMARMRGAAAAAAAAYQRSARAYVQDGLIFCLDGIENVGWGTHDANATRWFDLTGNYGPYNLASGMSVAENAIKNDGRIGSYINTGTRFGNPNDYTIEIVYNYTSSTEYASVFSCVESGGSGFQKTSTPSSKFLVGASSGYYGTPLIDFELGKAQSRTGRCDSVNGLLSDFTNGEIDCNVSYATTRWNNYTFLIGVDAGDSQMNAMNGLIHSIRFYNRALTAAEIAANYAVDCARFGLT